MTWLLAPASPNSRAAFLLISASKRVAQLQHQHLDRMPYDVLVLSLLWMSQLPQWAFQPVSIFSLHKPCTYCYLMMIKHILFTISGTSYFRAFGLDELIGLLTSTCSAESLIACLVQSFLLIRMQKSRLPDHWAALRHDTLRPTRPERFDHLPLPCLLVVKAA